MNVDEALAISDEPQNYTHLEQAAARNTLAAEVRRLRGGARSLVTALQEDERFQLGRDDGGEPQYSFTTAQRAAIAVMLGGTEVGA